ncbi:hypothetical protein FRC08_000686 [Ceratobasidium sp. 394]|nr:hypothetical protein FRC08_000686 [Ceratobasidium sp. 394]
MEGQQSFQWPEILPALDLPSMLAQSAEMFGIQGGEDNGAESDGYSSDSDGDENPPEQQPEPPTPTQATPTSSTHTAATSSTTRVPPETKATTGAQKAPDPKRSQIAQEREQQKRDRKAAELRAAVEEQEQQQAAKSKDQESTRESEIKLVIDKLDRLGLTMGDLVCYFFDPANQCDRWGGFWKNEAYFDEFMACITTRKNATPSGRERAHRWAIDHVKRTVHSEAQQVTTSQVLQSRHLPIDKDFVFQFRFKELQRQLTDLCPVMTEVAESFATSTAQQRRMNRSGQAEAAAAKLKKLKVSPGNTQEKM